MSTIHSLPIVIVGAGPVGLAAAAHLLNRGLAPMVLEAGESVGTNLRQWAHVRTFSPWKYNIDAASAALLEAHGWERPSPERYPTGGEIVEKYLQPLARTQALAQRILLNTRVIAITRQYVDLMKDADRGRAPFAVRVEQAGIEREILASAVIDASGTWHKSNPLGSSGLPALGERALVERIAYGIPDVVGSARARYAGKRVLVIGSGHSAFNVLQDLAKLAEHAPETRLHWAIRRPTLADVLGGGENDALEERGRLGLRIKQLVDTGALTLHTGFRLEELQVEAAGIVASEGQRRLPPVDEIIGATGSRPDLSIAAELRLDLDPATQSPRALAPLIDPNVHSCGTVRPHGAEELKHPEANFFIAGMKSYGRAPTFLLLTGFEQVRSIAAALAGDWEAARRVELVLPETGVCSTDFSEERACTTGGCGPSAPATTLRLDTQRPGCRSGC
jgi:thioredoxin reductase